MSGGHFEYQQTHLLSISEEIQREIELNGSTNDWGDKIEYSDKTIQEFKTAILILEQAYVYAQRIDWLLSGDDSEEDFHKRLEEDLGKLGKKFYG
jgi:hypothetical protein